MNELQLIHRAAEGNRESFCQLYDLYRERLFRYAFYRLRSRQDAEDAVSECVLSAWAGIGQLKHPEAFAAWIFRILSACCNRLIKSQIDARQGSSQDPETLQIAAAEGDADAHLILEEALDQLSTQEQDIVLLSVVAGLSSREIAGLTGLRPGSVRSKLSRSLSKLREHLE